MTNILDRVRLTKDLNALRSLLQHPSNWCQHNAERENFDGSLAYCMIGAIRATLDPSALGWDEYNQRRTALIRHFNTILHHKDLNSVDSIMVWNDSPHRTHDDILTLLSATPREVPT